MPRAYVCKGCQGRTTTRGRLCPRCCYEVVYGLYGGQWVRRCGVLVWQPDPPKTGRPPTPLVMTEADRKRGYSQYRCGIRTPFAQAAYREYQRLHKRLARAAA